jgi:hypothetical protein
MKNLGATQEMIVKVANASAHLNVWSLISNNEKFGFFCYFFFFFA